MHGHSLQSPSLKKLTRWLRQDSFRQRGFLKNVMYGIVWVATKRELPGQLRFLKYSSFRHPIKSARLISKVVRGRIESGSMILHLYGEKMLRDVLAACNELELKPFLAFGTLLGHIRDGGFIEHDFDIDLGMLEADYLQRGKLVELLQSRGYTVRLNTEHELSFTKYPFNAPDNYCCCVDIFCFKVQAKGVTCSIEDFERNQPHVYLFSADIFHCFERVKFMKRLEVLIPALPEKFLTENYGNWRIPKPDFDIWKDHINETT